MNFSLATEFRTLLYSKGIARGLLEEGEKLFPFREREESISRAVSRRAVPVKRAEPRVS